MKFVLHRFQGSILSTLSAQRDKRKRFQLLLEDRRTGVQVEKRDKNPEADLKRRYRQVLGVSFVLSIALLAGIAVLFPTLDIQATPSKPDQIIIQIEDLPETRQITRPPPPPRPALPIETEEENVPDDVTIETTDLELEDVPLDLPPPPTAESEAVLVEEEEILEVWKVEEKPRLIRRALPVYPAFALRAGLQGSVMLKVLLGRDGRSEQIQVLKGEEIFHASAREAVSKFLFEPARQSDRPVKVWLVIPIHFRLQD
ncbi:MAG: energy transducer TonB [Gemmatimonadota bacterium]|nr:energy transducer TonB [Gemmatimonadota bacterium]